MSGVKDIIRPQNFNPPNMKLFIHPMNNSYSNYEIFKSILKNFIN